METLLIATDFSPAAHNALLYGVELAKYLKARVVLFHAYQHVIPTADMVVMVTDEELEEDSWDHLKKEIDTIPSKGDISITIRTQEGRATESILSVAKEVNPSWIIVGMKGKGATARRIFGSTATSLRWLTGYPLIVVPEDAWFTTPDTIAFASDINEKTDMQILDPLHRFARTFSSNLHVVRVIKSVMDEMIERLAPQERLKAHLKDVTVTFDFIKDNDVPFALNDFVEKNKVDMVAMVAKEHSFVERVFVKSDVKEMMFKTGVPLMILPGKRTAGHEGEVSSLEAHA